MKIESGKLSMKTTEIALKIMDDKNESGLGSKAHQDSIVQPVPASYGKL